jgi:Fe-S-cluster formation regulator IscX/YfhJ
LSGNHIYTSGGGATNSAVIRGALRACNSNLLTVILPQGLGKQPPETQPLLMRVVDLIQQPQFDDLDFKEAASKCNSKILDAVDEVLTFLYHDSTTIVEALDAMPQDKVATKFYLD